MTWSTSDVAVCCSSASVRSAVRSVRSVGAPRSSLSSRTFSMAMTAWDAKFLTTSICLSVKGRTSCRVRRSCRLTQGRAAGGAWFAVTAARHEHDDDMVAVGEIMDVSAGLNHHRRRLVAERHGRRPWPVTVDHREV